LPASIGKPLLPPLPSQGTLGESSHNPLVLKLKVLPRPITTLCFSFSKIVFLILKNISELQPDTLHADTQGQSEPVFGLAYLLGIKLMPRMRTWNDVAFYRPYEDISTVQSFED
jgi:hypothetical protein